MYVFEVWTVECRGTGIEAGRPERRLFRTRGNGDSDNDRVVGFGVYFGGSADEPWNGLDMGCNRRENRG